MGPHNHYNEKAKKKNDKPTQKSESTPESQHQPDLFAAPTRETVKPEMQLSLTETELDEEIPQMLTANNPLAPQNVARFHTKERTYKLEAMVEQCAVVSPVSEEGKKQIENERLVEEALTKAQAEVASRASGTGDGDDHKHLRNQFNFSDRASQTAGNVPKHRGCYTEQAQTTTRNGSCSQWEIYDDYLKDIQAQKHQEQLNKKRSMKKTKNQETKVQDEECEVHCEDGVSLRAAKVIERMTMQNVFEEFGIDLKYWDDDSDAFRPHDASLLPLWTFEDSSTVSKHVTSICFNPKHNDVFAVAYGSLAALSPTFGAVAVFSLKNPAVPEMHFKTSSGVLSVRFHPEMAHLLAAGCHDGSVKIMDATGTILYDAVRHADPVWQVHWKSGSDWQLYSASADGRLGLWTFAQSEILFESIMTITTPEDSSSGLHSLDFNSLEETMYLVGTQEGQIYRCSTEYDSEYLDTYSNHKQTVYSVKWNRFCSGVFLSASEDWTVSVWDIEAPSRVILQFDLRAPVTDVIWAPYSSTVFAAITTAGYVCAFDLALNRHGPICEQRVVAKGALSKILFHPRDPLVLVGDTEGIVHSMKVSPNLRKHINGDAEGIQKESEKLCRVLDLARKSIVE